MNGATDAKAEKKLEKDIGEATQVILEAFAGLDEETAAGTAEAIVRQAQKRLKAIRAAERRCAAQCEALLTDNPSRDVSDPADLLAGVLRTYDAHIENQGDPRKKENHTALEMQFFMLLEEVRSDLEKGRRPQMSDLNLKGLIAELMARNALYDAMEMNRMLPEDEAAAALETDIPHQMLKDCAYAVAVLMKNVCRGADGKEADSEETGKEENQEENPEENQEENKEENEEASDDAETLELLTLKSCLTYRLGYIDHVLIERTDRMVRQVMNQRAYEAVVKANTPPEEKKKPRFLRLTLLLAAGAALIAVLLRRR